MIYGICAAGEELEVANYSNLLIQLLKVWKPSYYMVI